MKLNTSKYSGKNININCVSYGVFDYTYPFLSPNISPAFFLGNNASEGKISLGSTLVGAIIAGLKNEIGAEGIAYNAKLNAETLDEGIFHTHYKYFDITNHSLSFNPFIINWNQNKKLYDDFIFNACEGRNKLGSILVFSAGDDRKTEDANSCNLKNSLTAITVAATVNSNSPLYSDFISNNSPRGANILVSSPYNASRYIDNYITHDDYGPYFSSAVVSGIVALMLEANPYLGAMDVQKILAYSAIMINADTKWAKNGSHLWNGTGMHFSHDIGFGEVDAATAIKLAENWTVSSDFYGLGRLTTSSNEVKYMNKSFPYIKDFKIDIKDNMVIDRVTLDIDIEKKHLGDLKISIISPHGTESIILDRMGVTKETPRGYVLQDGKLHFEFSSTHFLGELAKGNWKVKIIDEQGAEFTKVNSLKLEMFGSVYMADRSIVFTDEFHQIYDNHNLIINEYDGLETLNLSALSGYHNIILSHDLNENMGRKNIFGGKFVEITHNTNIKNAIGGDEGNFIIGNKLDNILIGGSNRDEIYAVAGHNILVGRTGTNHLHSGHDADMFVINKNDLNIDYIYDFKFKDQSEIINIVGIKDVKSIDDLEFKEDIDGTHIYFAGQEIFVKNVKQSDLTPEHFKFDNHFDFFGQFDPEHKFHEWNDSLIRVIYGLED